MGNVILENPKATVTIIVSMVWVIVAYLLKAIWQITLPEEVVIAITTLLGILIGRWTRINKEDAKVIEVTTPQQKEAIIENAEKL
jgi:predicted Na+-dependent transporter